MTRIIHTNPKFRNVGMIEVVNEPISGQDSLASEYYPTAYDKIRETERSLGTTTNNYLHIQFMASSWGAGDARQHLSNNYFAAYDSHRYLKWDDRVPLDQNAYISTSCKDDVAWDGSWPLIVGEWSLATKDDAWNPHDPANKAFYKKWWAAQVIAYEKQAGWIFWSWKTELLVNYNGQWLPDYRWGYKQAVEAGIIPKDPKSIDRSVC